MSKEAIAATLKKLREQSKLTADEVGAKIGKSGKTVNAWENGRGQPDADILIQLCKIYKVNNILAEFNSSLKNSYMLDHSEQNVINKYRQLDERAKDIVNTLLETELSYCSDVFSDVDDEPETLQIPYYDDKAAAGNGYMFNDNGYELLTVIKNRNTERADFVVTVSGDSMEPDYSNNDKVLVHAQPDIYEGEIGIFIINNSGYIKKKGAQCLISLNKKYKDIYVGEYDTFRCAGKVISKLEEEDIIYT